MAQITTVRIEYGSIRVTVDLTYRWYTIGNDPWERVSGPVRAMPGSGEWENRAIAGSTTEVRMYSSNLELVAKLLNFTRVEVGSTGDGEFYPSGYTIPEFSSFRWRVINIS